MVLLISFLQTETDDVPTALLAFQGRLCAGVGKALRLYDIGKKKLLRKVEVKVTCSPVFVLLFLKKSYLDSRTRNHNIKYSRVTYNSR